MIEFKKVVKRFGDVKAIDDVSAAIDEGHVFGLIGTNGAGQRRPESRQGQRHRGRGGDL